VGRRRQGLAHLLGQQVVGQDGVLVGERVIALLPGQSSRAGQVGSFKVRLAKRSASEHGILEIHGVENPHSLSLKKQDGLDHDPCTPAWPKAMEQAYAQKWRAEHPAQADPAAEKPAAATSFKAPAFYDDTREHLANSFHSVKTRTPSVEDEHFGNNAAIAIHMANYSYFKQAPACWDAEAKQIRS